MRVQRDNLGGCAPIHSRVQICLPYFIPAASSSPIGSVERVKVVPFARRTSADAEEWPRDPDTIAETRSRLGNKLQRLAALDPPGLVVIEMLADRLLADAHRRHDDSL